jgi:hypothetical protein
MQSTRVRHVVDHDACSQAALVSLILLDEHPSFDKSRLNFIREKLRRRMRLAARYWRHSDPRPPDAARSASGNLLRRPPPAPGFVGGATEPLYWSPLPKQGADDANGQGPRLQLHHPKQGNKGSCRLSACRRCARNIWCQGPGVS